MKWIDDAAELDPSQIIGLPTDGGTVYVPIPADGNEAERLFQTHVGFYEAVQHIADTPDEIRDMLQSGPDAFEVPLESLGIAHAMDVTDR